jgi:translation initiation factor IF-1
MLLILILLGVIPTIHNFLGKFFQEINIKDCLILLDNGEFILSHYVRYRMMAEYIEVIGKIISVLPGTMFRVELPNKHVVLAHISGKLRKNFIKLMIGDTVKMEMSPQDLQKARIIFRMKNVEVPKNTPIRSFGPNRNR